MHCPHFTGAGSIYPDGALLSYTQVEAAFEYFKSNGTIVNIAHVDDVRVRTTTGEHRFELRMGHREWSYKLICPMSCVEIWHSMSEADIPVGFNHFLILLLLWNDGGGCHVASFEGRPGQL